jgi:predicted O-methyltransferase YrrM
MSIPLLVSNAVAIGAAGVFAGLFLRYRRRVQLLKGRTPAWPVPTVSLAEFDELFEHDHLGPTERAAAVFIGSGDGVPGGTSDREAWILAVLARRARTMFEFGTCTGRTTYLWAVNSPADARVYTLTLPPEGLASYETASGDESRAVRSALRESRFSTYRYSGTPEGAKVEQLYGDSKVFDENRFRGACDLVFVDGSHAYSYVVSDTEKALRMVRPGGIVLWHDYRGRRRGTEGVFRHLNDLSRTLPLVHLRGTSLVAYRAPQEDAR